MNRTEFNNIIKNIKIKYNVKSVRFKDVNNLGLCSYTEGIIYLHPKLKNNLVLACKVLYHEVGHIYCYDNGIWKSYHVKDDNNLTKRKLNLLLKTALKAERWVDRWAEKRIKELNPKMKFYKGYQTELVTKRFRKLLKEKYLQND